MTRTKFFPIKGSIYQNKGGGTFICLSDAVDTFIGSQADMINAASGWRFDAHGIGIYDDGTIDWDFSLLGRFDKSKLQEVIHV